MKAQSNVYVRLQNIYKSKARKDVAEVLDIVRTYPGGKEVDPSGVELFCKNAAFVKLINAAEDGTNGDRLAKVVGKYLNALCHHYSQKTGYSRAFDINSRHRGRASQRCHRRGEHVATLFSPNILGTVRHRTRPHCYKGADYECYQRLRA